MTVGERNMNKTNRTILLVGESGSGKSTLINSLVNYTMGVKFEDEVWFQIIKEERKKSESQTSDVIVYQIFGFEDKTLPYSLTIIDTPGYGNTRGIECDLVISQKLFDLFRSEDGVHEVNAVGLVMKVSDNRLSDRLMYVFNSVTSLFGKDLEKNIVALITHSDGRKPEDALKTLEAAKVKCAKNEKNQPVHFLFDNCQNEERTEETELSLENAWRVTERGMRQFKTFLEKIPPQQVQTNSEQMKGCIRLIAYICNLEDRIKMTELEQRVIRWNQEALKEQEEKMKKHEKEMKKHEKEMKTHEKEMKTHEKEMKKHEKEMMQHEEELKKCEDKMKKCEEKMKKCEEKMKKCEEEMMKHKQELKQREKEMKQHKQEMKQREEKMKQHKQEMKQRDEEMTKHEQEMTKHEQEMKKHEQEMKKHEEEMKKHEQEMKKHEEGKNSVFISEVYKEKELIKSDICRLFFESALSCKVCEENCHYPGCTMTTEHCEVMKDGRCTVCTNKCPVSEHVKEKWRYVNRARRVRKTEAEMKQKFEKNKSESEKKLSLVENLEKEMNQLRSEKSQLLDEAYQHVVNLKQIALNVDSVSTHVHLDFLIDKMKERGDREKVQKLEEIDGLMDEGTRAELQHMNMNISSKYEDIISRSIQISSGSPFVYQLKPKKEKFGSLTRMTVGERNMNKTNKTILLVGETGSGKSTLINSLVNYTMGVKFEDEVWFQIIEEEKRGKAESQTSDVIVYQIFGFEDKTLPYSLTIIDTPGYGDTRGIEHDLTISQRLFDLFRSEDGVHEVNAVGLVMKVSDNRLSDRLSYIFDSVVSLFGKNMEKNIVALITHSDGIKPKDALEALEAAKVKCAKNEKNQPVYFLFDNKQNRQRNNDTECKAVLKHSWDISRDGMFHFTSFLERNAPQKLITTVKVLKERVRLTACIQNLEERIKLTELKQNEIKQIQETLKKHEKEMKKNEKFTVEVDEVYKEKEPIDGGMWGLVFYEGAVCCKVCEENCHYPGCTMAWKPKHCEVVKGGHCTVCTNKCPVTDHVKEKWKYVTKIRRVQKTEEEMKHKFEKNKSESEKKLSLLENLEKEMNQMTSEKSQLLDEAYQHVVNLEQIALNVDSVSTYVHLDFLIEKMKERGDSEKVQKLEEMKNRMDEGTTAGVQYVWGKLMGIGKNVK